MADQPVIVSTSESRIGRLRDFTQSLFAGGGRSKKTPIVARVHPNTTFVVICKKTGGSAGSGSTTCDYVYDVETFYEQVILSNATPDKNRMPNVEYATPNALGERGLAYLDETGAVRLYDANEYPKTEECP